MGKIKKVELLNLIDDHWRKGRASKLKSPNKKQKIIVKKLEKKIGLTPEKNTEILLGSMSVSQARSFINSQNESPKSFNSRNKIFVNPKIIKEKYLEITKKETTLKGKIWLKLYKEVKKSASDPEEFELNYGENGIHKDLRPNYFKNILKKYFKQTWAFDKSTFLQKHKIKSEDLFKYFCIICGIQLNLFAKENENKIDLITKFVYNLKQVDSEAIELITRASQDKPLINGFVNYLLGQGKPTDIQNYQSPYCLIAHYINYNKVCKYNLKQLINESDENKYEPIPINKKNGFEIRKALQSSFPLYEFPKSGDHNILGTPMPGNKSGERKRCFNTKNRMFGSLNMINKLVKEHWNKAKNIITYDKISIKLKKEPSKEIQITLRDFRNEILDEILKMKKNNALEIKSNSNISIPLLIWIDGSRVNSKEFIKIMVGFIFKNTEFLKWNINNMTNFKKIFTWSYFFGPEKKTTFDALIPIFSKEFERLEQSPFGIYKVNFELVVSDLKAISLMCGCKASNSAFPCPSCLISKTQMNSLNFQLYPLKDPNYIKKVNKFKQDGLNFLIDCDDCIFQDKEGNPKKMDFSNCYFHFLTNQICLLNDFIFNLMDTKRQSEFQKKIKKYAGYYVDSTNKRQILGSMAKDTVHNSHLIFKKDFFDNETLHSLILDIYSNLKVLTIESYANILPTNRSVIFISVLEYIHTINCFILEKKFGNLKIKNVEIEASQELSQNNSQINHNNKTEIKSKKSVIKLYHHQFDQHRTLFRRIYGPFTGNTERFEQSWVFTKKACKHKRRQNVTKTIEVLNSIRNKNEKTLGKKKERKSEKHELTNEIKLKKELIYLENGKERPQFLFLMKNLADITNKNIIFNDDQSITFVCDELPNEGDDNMVFPAGINEDDLYEDLQNRYSDNIEQGKTPIQLKEMLGDDIRKISKREKPKLWMFDDKSLDNVPIGMKRKLLSYAHKHKYCNGHSNLKGKALDEKIKKLMKSDFKEFLKGKISTIL